MDFSGILSGITTQIQSTTGLSILCWTVLLDTVFWALIFFGLGGKWARRSSIVMLVLNGFIFLNLFSQGY